MGWCSAGSTPKLLLIVTSLTIEVSSTLDGSSLVVVVVSMVVVGFEDRLEQMVHPRESRVQAHGFCGGGGGSVPLRRLLPRRDGGKSAGSLTTGLFIRAMKSPAGEKSDGGDGYRWHVGEESGKWWRMKWVLWKLKGQSDLFNLTRGLGI
ncbi:hypothetical protein L6452_44101 [Arctium lappa]|uniref:Uncharacterized protein n=1 Tax=Arctium lappa TaxID=4217 RepID=A0ACB8XEC9_ARCLA|nr:hypothetical protein L6452_44101 [Arctium lappa]